jgi:ribokinase
VTDAAARSSPATCDEQREPARRGGVVVVVGSLNIDYLARVERRPSPGETLLGADLQLAGGGKGANQALAARRCGAEVELVARVGDDAGTRRVAELAAEGVGIGAVQVDPELPTGSAFITITPDGENTIVVAGGANRNLCAGDLEQAAELLAGAEVLVVQFEIPEDAIRAALERVAPSAVVIVNAAPPRALTRLELDRADVLVVNEHEAGSLLQVKVAEVEDALRAARLLRDQGPEAVIVTLGAAGAVLVDSGAAEHLPAPSAEVLDTTGAGDAFVGALASRLAIGVSLHKSCAYALRVASATTEVLGAGAVLPLGELPLGEPGLSARSRDADRSR